MLKKISIYLKNQTKYLIFLFIIFVTPLILFFQFSPYPLPNIQYAMLSCLLLFQYISYSEKKYRKKIGTKIFRQLQRELKRSPTNKEMHHRMNLVVMGRGLTVLFASFAIILTMIIYNKF